LLGCPTCRSEYPIRDGVAWFGHPPVETLAQPDTASADDMAMRAGAFLNVAEGSTIALVGTWANCATELAELVQLRVFALNPTLPVTESERVGIVMAERAVPFREASIRGLAIGESGWTEADVLAAVRALSPGGRIVAPSSTPVPSAVNEIVRDDSWWVGEKRGPLVSLHRR
jgi:hypothetical protein